MMPINLLKHYININVVVKDINILNKISDYKNYAFNNLNLIKFKHKIFNEFYINSYSYDVPNNLKGEELFTLDQILENYKSQNWITLLPEKVKNEFKEKYPNAGERYLQITSIEGGRSYFYDKETDYVYNVDWGEEENMITGKLKPWFTSFYDFLEWYYSEEE